MSMELQKVMMDAVMKQRSAVGKEREELVDIPVMYDTIIKLEQAARKEGILGLEEAVAALVKERSGVEADICDECSYRSFSGIERFLVALVRMLLNGHEPEQLEQVAVMRYCTAGFEGAETLCACMIITGILSIQSGEHPMVLQDKLLALLPEEIENRILERKAENREQVIESLDK